MLKNELYMLQIFAKTFEMPWNSTIFLQKCIKILNMTYILNNILLYDIILMQRNYAKLIFKKRVDKNEFEWIYTSCRI